MSNLQAYQGNLPSIHNSSAVRGAVQLDRKTRRELERLDRQWTLAEFDDTRKQAMVAQRVQTGALLTGELNFWLEHLSYQQDRLIAQGSTGAGRVSHTLDVLAVNGAKGIGDYMLGGL